MARSTHRLVSLATASLAVTMLAGCGAIMDTDTDDAGAPVPTRQHHAKKHRSTQPSSEAAPSPSVSEDALEEQPSAAAAATALPTRLLTAAELPGFNSAFRWTEGRTTKREPEALAGTCHRFSMLSIGAMRVAYREYTPADGSTGSRANELVAGFADAKTAWRAFEVLKSWQADCEKALEKYDHHDVGALQKVSVAGGEGRWSLLTYGPAEGETEADYLDAEGITLVGNRVAVLRMALVGLDYDYPAGQEPMVAAVRAAADKLR
jgi:hypothetical protein